MDQVVPGVVVEGGGDHLGETFSPSRAMSIAGAAPA
jgi:hypothetical protein